MWLVVLTLLSTVCLLQDPSPDGGQWDMVVNLINKYGLMPKTCFPESFSCQSSQHMNIVLKSKVSLFGKKELRGTSLKLYWLLSYSPQNLNVYKGTVLLLFPCWVIKVCVLFKMFSVLYSKASLHSFGCDLTVLYIRYYWFKCQL